MDIAVGLIIIVGGVIPYSHQAHRIIRSRSSEGISIDSAALNFFSSWLLVINIIILERNDWFHSTDAYTVAAETVALGQIIGSLVFTGVTAVLVFAFSQARLRFEVAFLTFIMIAITVMAGMLCYAAGSLFQFGATMGVLTSVLTGLIWLPQIVMLARSGRPGELSLVLVVFECFGSFLIFFYQAFMVEEHWTTWTSSAVLSVEQVVLLSLYLRTIVRKKPKEPARD